MTSLQFGVFVPQGWKMELSSIPDPVDKWAKAFEGLGAEQAAMQTGYWYRGVGPFDVYIFSQSIRSFSTVTSGTIVSKPSSSGASGFGGGGAAWPSPVAWLS